MGKHLQTRTDRFFSWFPPGPIIAGCAVIAVAWFGVYSGRLGSGWIVLGVFAAIALLVLLKIAAALVDLFRSFLQ